MRKSIHFVLLIILLTSCQSRKFSKFYEAPSLYTEYQVGQEYEILQDLYIVKYDYKYIPLAMPAVQLFDPEQYGKYEMRKRIIATPQKGDRFKVISYWVDGGWIPHGGNQLVSNPQVIILDGEGEGIKVGITLLSNIDKDKMMIYDLDDEFVWEFQYQVPNPEYFRLVKESPLPEG